MTFLFAFIPMLIIVLLNTGDISGLEEGQGKCAGLDKDDGPGIGTGDCLELAERSGIENGNRLGSYEGQADCAGLHGGASNGMFA